MEMIIRSPRPLVRPRPQWVTPHHRVAGVSVRLQRKFLVKAVAGSGDLPPPPVAGSGDLPPPPPPELSKLALLFDQFNEKFGRIEKFNTLLKSFDVYLAMGSFVIGNFPLVLAWVQTSKSKLAKLKTLAANNTYLGIAVLLIAAAAIWMKNKPAPKNLNDNTKQT